MKNPTTGVPGVPAALVAAYHRSRHPYTTCDSCTAYAKNRASVIAPKILDRATELGKPVSVVVDEFMDAVHERHTTADQEATRQA